MLASAGAGKKLTFEPRNIGVTRIEGEVESTLTISEDPDEYWQQCQCMILTRGERLSLTN